MAGLAVCWRGYGLVAKCFELGEVADSESKDAARSYLPWCKEGMCSSREDESRQKHIDFAATTSASRFCIWHVHFEIIGQEIKVLSRLQLIIRPPSGTPLRDIRVGCR